jgi:hypothetical protein
MRVRREDIEKLHLRQLEHLGRQIEARETKAKHIATRKNWMERQTNANYRNEFDRIRGELSHFRGSTVDRAKLSRRAEELQRLFSSGNV